MKIARKILTIALFMMIGVCVVNAEQANGTITITGTNTATKTLTLVHNSTTPGAYLKNIRWYYASTLGDPDSATSIPVTTNSLYLSQSYAGYYIYATAIITTDEEGYEDKSVSDVTDAATNGTATVSEATLVVGSVYISGTNTAGNTLTVNLASGATTGAYIKNCQWYVSDTNSTTGGTAVVGATSQTFDILSAYAGKYIYVSATISTVNSGSFLDNIVYDITDAGTNGTATVADSSSDPGTNPSNPSTPTNPTTSDYITTITTNPGYSITAEATYNAGATLTMTLNGIQTSSNTYYYVLLTNSNTAPTLTTDSWGCVMSSDMIDKNDMSKFKEVYNSNKHIAVAGDWYMLKDYTKAYVVKRTYTDAHYYCEVLTTPINVTKPAVRALGSRYQIYLFGDKVDASFKNTFSVFPYFPIGGTNGSHKLTSKIGLIKDKTVLSKLAKNSSDAMESLLAYAKSAEGKEYKYNDSDSFDMEIGTFDVINGSYYFIYTSYDNTDGLYRDLDDVTVVMGKNGILVNDVSYEGYVDDESTEEPEKKPEENPKTGIVSHIAAYLIVIALGIGGLVLASKKGLFKQI